MGAAAPAIFLAVGAGLKIGGAVIQAKAQRDQADAIAEAAEFNALQAEQQGLVEEGRLRRLARRKISSQRVLFAKAGVTLEGSPLFFLAQNAGELELDAANARIAARNSARLDRERADVALDAGRTAAGAALLAGLSGAFGTALSTQSFGRQASTASTATTSTSLPSGSFTAPGSRA